MKFVYIDERYVSHESLPAWGVRVEIESFDADGEAPQPSLPAWGVRVEIMITAAADSNVAVTPRMGSAG